MRVSAGAQRVNETESIGLNRIEWTNERWTDSNRFVFGHNHPISFFCVTCVSAFESIFCLFSFSTHFGTNRITWKYYYQTFENAHPMPVYTVYDYVFCSSVQTKMLIVPCTELNGTILFPVISTTNKLSRSDCDSMRERKKKNELNCKQLVQVIASINPVGCRCHSSTSKSFFFVFRTVISLMIKSLSFDFNLFPVFNKHILIYGLLYLPHPHCTHLRNK